MNASIAKQFHAYVDTELFYARPKHGAGGVVTTKETKHIIIQEREVSYRFAPHAHPFVPNLIRRLIERAVPGLQAADTEYQRKPDGSFAMLPDGKLKPVLYSDYFSATRYNPSALVRAPLPVKDLDFTSGGAYAVYNWELFFHVPLMIAMHLSKNQRFAEAQQWFHYIFDPTDDSDGPTPGRFWKVRPFQYTHVQKIEQILVNLSTGADPQLRDETIRSIEAWKDAPFRPHVVARYRQQAYMFKTVMAYLDNLIAWGDSLFRQDTREAIDEAMIVYVLAANILGTRPLPVPERGKLRPQTYANLREDLDKFGNALRRLEADAPFDLTPHPSEAADNQRMAVLTGLGKALYFCVPRNDKLLGYWDTVADRLFKIRNSLNIQGVFRQLPLFEPPIDPALLARAAAAGLDVGAIVNGLNQPLPLVRFAFLVQKANEIVQEVKSLGTALLAAMEKEDGEAMALLRAKQERTVLEMAEHVKYAQLQEASKTREGLVQTLANAVERYTYYERQLGKKPDEIAKAIPDIGDLEKGSLEKMTFAMKESGVTLRPIEVDIAQNLDDSGGKLVSSHEREELSASHSARDWQVRSSTTATIASMSYYVPSISADIHFWGMGGTIEFGGKHIGPAFQAISEYQKNLSTEDSYDASHAGKIAGYQRREQDWSVQSNIAAGEINQICKQLRAAQIREAMADIELNNHRQQIKHAEEIEFFLTSEKDAGWKHKIDPREKKTTNKALYTWMKREVKGLYAQCFQLAFDVAKKAERALQHELGNSELSYLQFGYLAGKEGLLAGEKLYLDVRRMEMAYHDQNRREYGLTKHVSLLQIDPMALLQLRFSGRCTVRVPEALFDMDGPGHYFRRIKSLAVSIPCVTGPYASVNCTLTLLNSSTRIDPSLRGGEYSRQDGDDNRFSDYFGSLQSIVTSSAQNDNGLFEGNLRDERYLPFENSGAISEWQLQMPASPGNQDPAQFDYQTISDVILHMRYTAREGGELLRSGALAHLKAAIRDASVSGCVRLFSVRQEFPTEWANFQAQTPAADQRCELALTVTPEHYPFWATHLLNDVSRVDVLARSAKAQPPARLNIYDQVNDQPQAAKKDTLVKAADLSNLLVGRFTGGATGIALPASAVGTMKLYLDEKDLSDLWLAVTWNGK
jgi:hypothetical protein